MAIDVVPTAQHYRWTEEQIAQDKILVQLKQVKRIKLNSLYFWQKISYLNYAISLFTKYKYFGY